MSRSPRGLVLIASACATTLTLFAQPTQQPVFRAGTDYVQLDVVVTDKNDKAIRDLTKADFEITEHGRVQALTDFEFVAIPPSHRPVTDVKTTAPTLDVVSNAHPPGGRQWVLVIDDLHIIEHHLLQTKKVIQDFLEALPAEDQVAIVFVGRSDLSQGFTNDLGAQMRTVNRIKTSLGFAYDSADAGGASGDAALRDRHRYAIATVDVLKNIAASLSRSTYPRKALVYVSEGMTYHFEGMPDVWEKDVFDQLTETFTSARRAGVPVYPIDPRGIPDCTSARSMCDWPTLWPNIVAQMNQMRTLAENTGGLAFVSRENVTAAVHELIEDNSSFYVLGYYPQPFERDGKFHDVKVTVKRPGTRVRARAGYEAPKALAATVAETKRTLDDALGAALPDSGLTLRAFAGPVAPGLHGMKTVVTVEVQYPLPADGAKINDELQFGMLALDHDGKSKGSARRAFHFTASPKGTADVTYAINDVIELPSQPLELRIAVASRSLGKSGAIHIPVEAINSTRDELQLGAVVVGLDGPIRETAVPAGALKDLVPFQPTTARVFAATDTLRVFVPLFWASRETAASVTLSIRRADAVLTERHEQVSVAPGSSPHRHTSFVGTLPLANVPPGSYVLEVSGRLATGQPSTRDVAIEIR